MFRSSRIRAGRGASALLPSCRRKARASTPSLATCKRIAGLVSRKASRVSRTSPGLSSTSRTSTEVSLSCMGPSSSLHGFHLASCQGKEKGGTLPGLGLDRDVAAVPFDDLLADGQADAGAGKLFPLVQPLEHAKNLFKVLRINSQSVVFHRKHPFIFSAAGDGDMHLGNAAGALVLDGISDQVLEQLNELGFIRQDRGQGTMGDQRPPLFDGTPQIEERALQGFLAGGVEQVLSFGSHPRIGQQVL